MVEDTPTPARHRGAPLWLLAVALVPCGLFLAAELVALDGELGFPLDDSWIHLVFARHLDAGAGLSFTPGELVPGSTAPLWTALLSLCFLPPFSPLAWAKLLGVAAHLCAVDASCRLAGALDLPRGLGLLAGVLVASTGWLVWSALAAMEVPFFAALSLWGMALHVGERGDPRRLPLALPVLALACLLRPEGLILLVLAVADAAVLVVRRSDRLAFALSPAWRRVLWALGAAAVLLLPVFAFNLAVGGSALPTTFSTKAGYSPPGLPDLHYLYVVLGIFFQAHPVATVLAGGGAATLVARLGGDRDRGLLPVTWMAALPIAYAVLSANTVRPLVGNFGRYFFPLFPVVVVLGMVGLEGLWRRWPRQLSVAGVRLGWRLWLGLAIALPSLHALALTAGRYSQSVLNVHQSDVAMAELVRDLVPPEAVLAVNDIGAMGYLLPNEIVDLAGIASPEVHDYARRAVAEKGDWRPGISEFIDAVRPDYVVVFPAWFPDLEGRPGFVPLVSLAIEGNITMGGDQVVLYATPWTRHPLRQLPAAEPGTPGGGRGGDGT